MLRIERQPDYSVEPLPVQEDVERFAPEYTPEEFTEEELRYLTPFFTNTDKPIYVVKNLPPEVSAALASRYSRATKSLRRLFLDEYIDPIRHPESQKGWDDLPDTDKAEAEKVRDQLNGWIAYQEEQGGMEDVVNVQRGRAFFEKWLAQYGDDSIAELGGALVALEGVSNVAAKEIQDKRLSAYIEKSSRYVQFFERKANGQYQYVVPGEIRGTEQEAEYRATMDNLFATYERLQQPYLEYIQEWRPREEGETAGSFKGSRSAKRFDDLRDLLPFATETNFAISANGRAYEDFLTRMMDHPLGEMRWIGQTLHGELAKVVPSFVKRPASERGAKAQRYRSNIISLRERMANRVLKDVEEKPEHPRWVSLQDYDRDAEVKILAAFLFSADTHASYDKIYEEVARLTPQEREEMYDEIFEERKFGEEEEKRESHRFRKVPRAFENAKYMFEMWGRGGDYRDLHRHRMATQERQRFTSYWGHDLEAEVLNSPFKDEIVDAIEKAEAFSKQLEEVSPDIAQYAVPFGDIQHWYMNLTPREIYWMVELRTGPQGRPHYRQICQQVAQQAMEASPTVFKGLMVDMNNYDLSRRESEKKKEQRLKQIEEQAS